MANILEQAAVDPAANLILRNTLLATSVQQSMEVTTTTASKGETKRIKLKNVGITTRLRIKISAAVTIGTDALTASDKSPWSLISNINVMDFNQQKRCDISGFHLWAANCMRNRTVYGYNNEAKSATASWPNVSTAIGAGTVDLFLEVPLAYDRKRDLRGAILAQSGTGEWSLNISFRNPYLVDGDVDSVYKADGSSGTCTEGTITITVWQDYLQPQPLQNNFNGLPVGITPIPVMDLSTVYALEGMNIQTDNLSNGAEKLINIPNARTVIGAITSFVNNKAMSNAFSRIRLVANGNQDVNVDDVVSAQMRMREWLNGDTVNGLFFWEWRDNPLQTWQAGTMQLGFTPNASLTTPYIETTFESFYGSGAVLPGTFTN